MGVLGKITDRMIGEKRLTSRGNGLSAALPHNLMQVDQNDPGPYIRLRQNHGGNPFGVNCKGLHSNEGFTKGVIPAVVGKMSVKLTATLIRDFPPATYHPGFSMI